MQTQAKLMDEQGLTWNGMRKGINNMKEYEEKIERREKFEEMNLRGLCILYHSGYILFLYS